MKNFELVKEWILTHDWIFGPKDETAKEKLRNGDALFLMNVYMIGNEKRSSLAKAMYGSSTPCVFCWKHPDYSNLSCPHRRFPLTNCRSNILQWLDFDVGAKAPSEWLKRLEKEVKEAKEKSCD